MLDLLNEYDCNLDSKGRFMFPAKWRKQLEDVLHMGLVVTRDRQANCLIVYPKPQWDKMYKNIELLAETIPTTVISLSFLESTSMNPMSLAGSKNLPVASSSTCVAPAIKRRRNSR